jgi:RTX calcium-binding nonapeptide repeat (4 copies)
LRTPTTGSDARRPEPPVFTRSATQEQGTAPDLIKPPPAAQPTCGLRKSPTTPPAQTEAATQDEKAGLGPFGLPGDVIYFNPDYADSPDGSGAAKVLQAQYSTLGGGPYLYGATFQGSLERTIAHEFGHLINKTFDVLNNGAPAGSEQAEADALVALDSSLASQQAATVQNENIIMAEIAGTGGAPADAGLLRGVYYFRESTMPVTATLTGGNIVDRAIAGATDAVGNGEPVAYDFRSLGNSRDLVWAGGGDDVVWSGGGNDYIYGGEGKDIIYGGIGNDVLYNAGSRLNDATTIGLRGDDQIADGLYGSTGADKYYL